MYAILVDKNSNEDPFFEDTIIYDYNEVKKIMDKGNHNTITNSLKDNGFQRFYSSQGIVKWAVNIDYKGKFPSVLERLVKAFVRDYNIKKVLS